MKIFNKQKFKECWEKSGVAAMKSAATIDVHIGTFYGWLDDDKPNRVPNLDQAQALATLWGCELDDMRSESEAAKK